MNTENTSPLTSPEQCAHDQVEVAFDLEAAKAMPSAEIRRRWPRFDGPCPQCKCQLIKYASTSHYHMGDW